MLGSLIPGPAMPFPSQSQKSAMSCRKDRYQKSQESQKDTRCDDCYKKILPSPGYRGRGEKGKETPADKIVGNHTRDKLRLITGTPSRADSMGSRSRGIERTTIPRTVPEAPRAREEIMRRNDRSHGPATEGRHGRGGRHASEVGDAAGGRPQPRQRARGAQHVFERGRG